jgi:phosphinothricin acetyltransferase
MRAMSSVDLALAPMSIRHATLADLSDIVELYNHYVLGTPATFDLEPATVATRTPWFEQFDTHGPHQLFVATVAGPVERSAPSGETRSVVGYACSARFHVKAAYRTSVETTIYVDPAHPRCGIGKALYLRLFDALAVLADASSEAPVGERLHRAYAGITLPNTASVGLHQHFGFTLTATYHEVGFKHGRHWDVGWFEKRLG